MFEGLRISVVLMTVFAELCSCPTKFLIPFTTHACVELYSSELKHLIVGLDEAVTLILLCLFS
jgi:hypothetical protein